MRLVRYGEAGKEKPGILDGQGAVRDLSGVVADIDEKTGRARSITRFKITEAGLA